MKWTLGDRSSERGEPRVNTKKDKQINKTKSVNACSMEIGVPVRPGGLYGHLPMVLFPYILSQPALPPIVSVDMINFLAPSSTWPCRWVLLLVVIFQSAGLTRERRRSSVSHGCQFFSIPSFISPPLLQGSTHNPSGPVIVVEAYDSSSDQEFPPPGG